MKKLTKKSKRKMRSKTAATTLRYAFLARQGSKTPIKHITKPVGQSKANRNFFLNKNYASTSKIKVSHI
jgi:hypothetical protein